MNEAIILYGIDDNGKPIAFSLDGNGVIQIGK